MFSWDIQTICISKGLVFTPFQENYEYFTILSDKTFFFCQMLPLNDDDPGHFPKQYHIVKRSGLSLPYLNLPRHSSFKIQEGIAIFNDSLF